MDTKFQKSLGHVSSRRKACNTPCKYFKKGTCKLGALCRFLHINPKDRGSTPETHEQAISKTICNQICKYGRRPFLHLVVLYGSDPHVSAYAQDVLEKILLHGIDVSIQKYLQEATRFPPVVGFRKREVVRTENLAEIICSSHADFLIVIGDRNMKNYSCQAKRKGKLIEMRVNDMISLIWKSWPQNPHKTLARIQNLTATQNELLLSQYCGLRHGNARIQYLYTMANELKKWCSLTSLTESVNKQQLDTGLSNLQLSSIHLHKQFKKCIDLFDELPVHQDYTESQRGCIMALDYKPNSSRSSRHFISNTLKKHLKRVLFDMMKQTEANLEVLSHVKMQIWVEYITSHNLNWSIDLDALQLSICDGENVSGLDGSIDTIEDSFTTTISEVGKSKTMDYSNLSTPLLQQSQTSQSQSPLSSTTTSPPIGGWSNEFGMINDFTDILGINSGLKKSPNQCDLFLSLGDSSDCEIEKDEPEDNGRIVSEVMEDPSLTESPTIGINFISPYNTLQKKQPQNVHILGDPKNRSSITTCTGFTTPGSPVPSNNRSSITCTGFTPPGSPVPSNNRSSVTTCTGFKTPGSTVPSNNRSSITTCTGFTPPGSTVPSNNRASITTCTGFTPPGSTVPSNNRSSITTCTGFTTPGSPVPSNEPQPSLSLFDMPLSFSFCDPKPRTNFSPVVGSPPQTRTFPPTPPIGPTLIPQISSPFSMVSLSLSCLPSMTPSIFMSPFIQPPCRNDSVSTCRTSDHYEVISQIWGESQEDVNNNIFSTSMSPSNAWGGLFTESL